MKNLLIGLILTNSIVSLAADTCTVTEKYCSVEYSEDGGIIDENHSATRKGVKVFKLSNLKSAEDCFNFANDSIYNQFDEYTSETGLRTQQQVQGNQYGASSAILIAVKSGYGIQDYLTHQWG